MIELKNVSFKYELQEEKTIKNLDLYVKQGEFVGIIGKNGSGKTTLLKLITGQLPPRSGSLIRADFSSIYIDQEYSIVRNDRTVYELSLIHI